jgi:protein phosphatase
MGTTLTMLLTIDDKAIMAHVGDSRLYVLSDGDLHLLSHDHTVANELAQLGHISPAEVTFSPYANVLTRSIGQQEIVRVDTLIFELSPADTCLLCSDGLSNCLEDSDELRDLLGDGNAARIPGRLVDLANSRGGYDNISVIVLRIEPAEVPATDGAVGPRPLALSEPREAAAVAGL